MRRPRVVVIGDVAVDVLVEPARAVVAGADVPARIRSTPGGAGANTAAWLAHLGADVTLAARVGDDPAGRDAATGLAAYRVRAALTVDADRPTCTVVALLGDADRTLLSDRGAAAALSPADLPVLDGFDHLHLSGYVLLDASSRPAGLAALAGARSAGLTTSVDPQVAPALGPEFRDWVRGVDLLLPNADELAALGGTGPLLADGAWVAGGAEPTTTGAAGHDGRGRPGIGAVVATAGPGGAVWTDRTGRWSTPSPTVTVVDATGAGDAFDAGLLMAWLTGAGPAAALRAGCAAGAAAVGRLGARPPRH